MALSTKGKKLSEKKWLDDEEKLERLAVLIIREIDRIIYDLELRRDLLFSLWSRERIRLPLLRSLSSRFFDIQAELLVLFPPDTYQQLDDFYRALDAFIFYVAYTEDMPKNLSMRFDAHLEDLRQLGPPLIERLKELVPDTNIELSAFEPPTPDLGEVDSGG